MGKVGGLGLKPEKCDERLSMPWQFISDVECGRASPYGHPGARKKSQQQVADFIQKHEKRFKGARLIEDGELPPL